MSFDLLAQELIAAEQTRATPVIAVSSSIRLRSEFFIGLLESLVRHPRLNSRTDAVKIRLDWIQSNQGSFSFLGHRIARIRASRLAWAIQSQLPWDISVDVTSVVRRPVKDSLFVIGWCKQRVELPQWARAIRLEGSSNG